MEEGVYMIDIEKRRKWNYNETSSKQFEKYVGKMNNLHQTPSEQYPGQFPLSGLVQPRTPKEARQMFKQQQLYQTNGPTDYSMLPHGMSVPGPYNHQLGYVVQQVPPTPIGFIGVSSYYGKRGRY